MARILIVDDDRDIVDTTRIFLESQGHEVAAAHTAEDGMRSISELTPDLLILDVMMGHMDDGIVMAQDLRRDGYEGPILMLTGLSKIAGQRYDKSELVPVDEFQEKPIDPAILVAKVADLLKRKEK